MVHHSLNNQGALLRRLCQTEDNAEQSQASLVSQHNQLGPHVARPGYFLLESGSVLAAKQGQRTQGNWPSDGGQLASDSYCKRLSASRSEHSACCC